MANEQHWKSQLHPGSYHHSRSIDWRESGAGRHEQRRRQGCGHESGSMVRRRTSCRTGRAEPSASKGQGEGGKCRQRSVQGEGRQARNLSDAQEGSQGREARAPWQSSCLSRGVHTIQQGPVTASRVQQWTHSVVGETDHVAPFMASYLGLQSQLETSLRAKGLNLRALLRDPRVHGLPRNRNRSVWKNPRGRLQPENKQRPDLGGVGASSDMDS